MAAKFEIASAKAGQFTWALKSQGRTLATGESYSRKVSAEKAIDSLRKAAAAASVADLTVKPKAAPSKRTAKPAKAAAKAAKTARKSATKATANKKAAGGTTKGAAPPKRVPRSA
jgi:uncharacterized protein YegP (UPF0339 family)